MAEKETKMKLKVDLHCGKCYKKVKKLLSKFPEIREQAFNEKENIVTITVVSSSPEKIRDKLCCKGGCCITSIEILPPPPPPPPPTPEPKPKPKPKPECCTPKKCCTPKECKPKVCKTQETECCTPKKCCTPQKCKPKVCETKEPECCTPKKCCTPKECKPECPATKPPTPPISVPCGICCVICYVCGPGGPCVCGNPRPQPCYGGCYGRPSCGSYGCRPCYVSRCDQYFCEENATGCTMM